MFKYIIGLYFLFFATNMVISQEKSYTNLLDTIIWQKNIGLFNGLQYVEKYRTDSESHMFFLDRNFKNGSLSLVTKKFSNIPLKYDVFDDALIVKSFTKENVTALILDNSIVKSFEIEGHEFSFLHTIDNKIPTGYYELLYENASFSLYKKHIKKIVKKTSDGYVNFGFKDTYTYYFYYENEYTTIKKPANFVTIFPDLKYEIQLSITKHKKLSKTDYSHYLVTILEDIFKNKK
ncbi:MAG: hypothetical protein NWQ38_11845 [Cellulophaga sp.]|nr:hypothetical protein [Cellulophaga sp.]